MSVIRRLGTNISPVRPKPEDQKLILRINGNRSVSERGNSTHGLTSMGVDVFGDFSSYLDRVSTQIDL